MQKKISLFESQNNKSFFVESGKTLLSALQENAKEDYLEGHCNGRGSCGRCRVRFLEGAPLPSPSDRRHFSAQDLRAGFRLACTSRVEKDCTVEVLFAREEKNPMTVLLESGLQSRGAGDSEAACFIAVDIGTTTIAMELVNPQKGEIVASHAFLNPGRRYGADVILRVQAAVGGNAESQTVELRQSILQGAEALLQKAKEMGYDAREDINPEKPTIPEKPSISEKTTIPEKPRISGKLIITGNTAMEHIFMGESLKGLERAPFDAGELSTRSLTLQGWHMILMAGISAFVGADMTAGVLACQMHEREEISLLVDLGTNGEMVLGNRERMLATATAAGPAFEGNVTAGVYGADMTAMLADLRRQNILDASGLLIEPYFSEGITQNGVYLTQQNVREFQLAKAAVRQGIETLLKQYGITAQDVKQVFLAGGFGYYLKEEDALRLGLLPKEFAGKVISAGNTALAGAVRYGIEPRELSFVKQIEAINLAKQENFGEQYLTWLNF